MISIYLVCLIFGAAMSLLSFLSGAAHFHIGPKFHLPHHGAHFHFDHVDAGKVASLSHLSFFNFAALMAFLTWFGGAGYLATRYAHVVAVVGLALAIVAGVIGASAVNLFLVKFLIAREKTLDHAELTGTVALLTLPLRERGTAEIVYSQHGTRRSVAARTEDGSALPKGSEVVITRYQSGIAYVRPLEAVLDSPHESSSH